MVVLYGQMERTVQRAINDELRLLSSSGQPVRPTFLHVRWLGGAAASGRRQAVFTVGDMPSANAGIRASYRWWTYVPVSIDPRGWRYVQCRWFTP